MVNPDTYYGPQSYNSHRIPRQADAPPRKLMHKLVGTRLPWGKTQDVFPDNIMEDPTPEKMRFWEKFEREKAEQKANGTWVTRPFEHLELHYKHDHEVIRHAQLPFRSQFWLWLSTFCKWALIMLLPFAVMVDIVFELNSKNLDLNQLIKNSISVFFPRF